MYLVKCLECGCRYTLREKSLKAAAYTETRCCPDCGTNHVFNENTTIEVLSGTGIEIMRIPDDSKMEVNFTF